jgi:TolB protein
VRGTDGGPYWSPDGKQLAFVDCADVTEGSCVVRVREGDVDRELVPIDYGNPAWSPDGTQIALVRCDDVEDWACAVFVVPAKGGSMRRVTEDGLFGQPVWSPDGRRIAFDATPQHGIAVVALDGSGLLWSTPGDDYPAWSPDGRQLAFMRSERLSGRGVRHDLYVIQADGTGARRITDGETNAASPAWSPDGTRLAYVQWSGHGECPSAAVFAAAPDGSNPRRVTPYRPLHADPVWSPDGRQIAFVRLEECWSEEEAVLWLVPAEGGEARPVLPLVRPEAGVAFAWRPAS